MYKPFIALLLLSLTACTSTTPATPDLSTKLSDLTPHQEDDFTISVPQGYQLITPDSTTLTLPQSFVLGLSEVRLDDDYARSITVHTEELQQEVEDGVYALALADNASTLPDYEKVSLTEIELSGAKAHLHEYLVSTAAAPEQVRVRQISTTSGKQAYITTCTEMASTSPSEVCMQVLKTFTLK